MNSYSNNGKESNVLGRQDSNLDLTSPSVDELKESINTQLKKLGFTNNGNRYAIEGQLSKQRIRDIYSRTRTEILNRNKDFIEKYGSDLVMNFAAGQDVNPEYIDPELVEVRSDSKDSRLFRFACLLWSVPVSQGFGRRMRFWECQPKIDPLR